MATTIWTPVNIYNPGTAETKEYPADTSFEPYRREAFRHRSISAQRQSIMLTNIAGEGTVNTEGLWRREQVDWSMGAGQFSLDRKGDAQENRFLSSKGVDVFSFPLQATLLPDTYQAVSNAGSNLLMTRCGDYIVVASGGTVTKYTPASVGSSWGAGTAFTVDTTYGGSSFGTINSITGNDTYLFIATTTGVWFGLVTGSTLALYAAPDTSSGFTSGYNMIRWANDQVVASCNNRLYAFQPRSAATVAFGTAPSTPQTTPLNLPIAQFTTVPPGWSLAAGSTTAVQAAVTPTNLTTGQYIQVNNSRTKNLSNSTATFGSGSATLNFTGVSNLGYKVGEQVDVTWFYTHRQFSEKCTITAIPSSTSITMTTTKATTNTNFAGAAILGSPDAGYGYNNTYYIVSVDGTHTGWFYINEANPCSTAVGGAISTPAGSNIDVLYTHQNPNWVWSDATGGETQIYFAGYANSSGGGHSGCVYRSNLLGSTTTNASGLAAVSNSSVAQPWNLDTPLQALPMSPDEYPTCIKSYLNFIFVGTNRGIRMAQTLSIYDPTATATGDLKSGPLIPNILQSVTKPVRAIVGDGRFVWFGWSNYDGSSTGLGKLDLTTYIAGDPLAPAYASDLMVSVSPAEVVGLEWDSTHNVPVIAVQGSGVYSPYASNLGQGYGATITKYVASGTLNSGVFDYGISDQKFPVYFDYAANTPANTAVAGQVNFDPNPPSGSPASTQTPTSNAYVQGQGYPLANNPYVKGTQFQTILTLSSTSGQTNTPTLHRWVLKAWPAVVSGTQISAVLRMYKFVSEDGGEYYLDPYKEFVWLETRRQNQDIVTYTEGPLSVQCIVDELDMIPHKYIDDYEGGLEGDIVVYLKTIGNYTYTAPALS